MAEIIRMPKLSDTMVEGVVAEWHKKIGESVEEGELIAEIETDKATMEFESFFDGVLLHIGVEKGKAAPVNDILAIIGEKGEDIKALLEAEASGDNAKVEEKVEEKETRKPAPVSAPKIEAPKAASVKVMVEAPKMVAQPSYSDNGTDLKISPLAKNLANDKGLNLSQIKGTGEGGRIVKRDVDNFKGGNAASYVNREIYSEQPVSQMRKTIARRLGESKFTAPHFYLTISIDMDNAMEARNAINKSIAPSKVSFNDLVIKSAAASLKLHPAINASWQEDTIRYNEHVNVGVAVSVEDGLLVPVVRFADGKTLSQISNEVRVLAKKAKDKKLQPQEWEGNTFTISNLGMFGIEEFTAIINTPDSCILAIGGISQVPVVKKGKVVPGNIMKVTLSCDHRVVDGVAGSKYLQSFKNFMENPVLLLGAYNI
ncbi:MAG: pyruvate dehydrogenase E2 component (dihydrolipoamide acetyltransferase) [Flavobacteriales bacterium]|jgi:pyruvate dehydrogenase E2 component (dihydrolipoamide acetyltransferase)|tara:strand:- start:146 stop:1429 length:1284 start_codon:yes stop_codon:yes gene_type:complete